MTSPTATMNTVSSRCWMSLIPIRPTELALAPGCPGASAGSAGGPLAGARSAVSLTSPLLSFFPMLGTAPRRRQPPGPAIAGRGRQRRQWPGMEVAIDGRGPGDGHSRSPAGDRAGPLDQLLILAGALEPARGLHVRIHAGLVHEGQAGVRGGWGDQAAGQLEQVEPDDRQEALLVRRLVDGEVQVARLDRLQGLRGQVEAAGRDLVRQPVLAHDLADGLGGP